MSEAISHRTRADEFNHKLTQIDSLADGIASLLENEPGERIGSAHYLLFSIQDLVRDLMTRADSFTSDSTPQASGSGATCSATPVQAEVQAAQVQQSAEPVADDTRRDRVAFDCRYQLHAVLEALVELPTGDDSQDLMQALLVRAKQLSESMLELADIVPTEEIELSVYGVSRAAVIGDGDAEVSDD